MCFKLVIYNTSINNKHFEESDFFSQKKKQFLNKHISYNEVYEKIYKKNIEKVISVVDLKEARQSILLAGEVQSGKTNNMLFISLTLSTLGFNKIIYFTGTKNNLNQQNISRFKEFYTNITIRDFSNINKGFNFTNELEIFYGLKQNLSNLLSIISAYDAVELEKLRVLIIDDESDEASSEKSKPNRTINTNIVNLYKLPFKNVIYLPVTATPYANISSFTDGLTPDFVIPLESSEEYCGIKKFIEKQSYVEIEEAIVSKLFECEFDKEVKNFLEKTMIDFFVQCFISNRPYKFLLNIYNEKKKNKSLETIIRSIIGKIISKDSSVLKDFVGEGKVLEFKNLVSKSKVKLVIEGNPYDQENIPELIIGGPLLSRGITFDNLLFEIMLNLPRDASGAADTLLQRARWFGYRLDYIDQMKILTSKKGCEFYKDIMEIDSKVRRIYENENMDNSNKYKSGESKIKEIKEIFCEFNFKLTN